MGAGLLTFLIGMLVLSEEVATHAGKRKSRIGALETRIEAVEDELHSIKNMLESGGKTSGGGTPLTDAFRSVCDTVGYTEAGKKYVNRRLKEFQEDACLSEKADCLDYGLPRNYVAYHLGSKKITMDGKLDEPAWQEVPWTENFVDMRAEWYPTPRLDTRVKIRWDNKRLFVGAYLQETDLWATFTEKDSQIFKDNGFEMFVDADGTLHNYKQMQVNCLGTTMDQVLTKSSHDAGTKIRNWTAGVEVAVFTKGTVNNPNDQDQYWSVEWSFTFKSLSEYTTRNKPTPSNNEVWFMQFGRSEWLLRKLANGYEKAGTLVETVQEGFVEQRSVDWWSWNPCGAVNLHLQNRWGLVQFRRSMNDKKFSFPSWHIYKTLFDVFDAMRAYLAVNSKYTTNLEDLTVPPYVFSRTCVDVPTIQLVMTDGEKDFHVNVTSQRRSLGTGHIRNDRFVWFD